MTIRLLGPGDEVRLEAFLAAHADSSMFLWANLRRGGLADHGQEFQGTYAAALEGGRITGVAAHYWNGVLILQAPAAAVRLAHAAAAVTGRSIIGLVGPWTQVDKVRTGLDLDRTVRTSSREALFALPLADLIVPAALAAGRVACRRAGPRDLDLVTSWCVASEVELYGAQDTPHLRAEEARGAEALVARGDAFLLEAGGRIVSICTHGARVLDVVQIGGVWTPPELRGRGYARAVVAGALLAARAADARRAVLFTGEGNIPAQQAYRALGFERVGDYGVMRFAG
jgi:ribosomal protein S18 acetylase RimI-like enzyme